MQITTVGLNIAKSTSPHWAHGPTTFARKPIAIMVRMHLM